MQTQDKDKKPFQIIHRFIAFVKLTHRDESVRKSGKMKCSDDELLVIAHLEQAANDVRHANIKLIQRAKKIISKSSAVPSYGEFRRFLLAAVELLLIEATARQRNPALYDFLYHDTLWYFHNKDEIPVKVRYEIAYYLAYGSPYKTPEEDRKEEEMFNKIIEYGAQRPLSVKKFVREKVWQMPDYERKDFISSRNVKDWVVKWHAEYTQTYAVVSRSTVRNCVSRIRKREAEQNSQK